MENAPLTELPWEYYSQTYFSCALQIHGGAMPPVEMEQPFNVFVVSLQECLHVFVNISHQLHLSKCVAQLQCQGLFHFHGGSDAPVC